MKETLDRLAERKKWVQVGVSTCCKVCTQSHYREVPRWGVSNGARHNWKCFLAYKKFEVFFFLVIYVCATFIRNSFEVYGGDVRPVILISESARGNRLVRDDSSWSIVRVYLTLIVRTMFTWQALVGNWTRGYRVPDFIIVLPRFV